MLKSRTESSAVPQSLIQNLDFELRLEAAPA